MKQKRSKTLSVRLEPDDLENLCVISARNYRSRSSQVMVWIRKCIQEYEKTYGNIPKNSEQQ